MLDATDVAVMFFDLHQRRPRSPNRRVATKDGSQPLLICGALEQKGELRIPDSHSFGRRLRAQYSNSASLNRAGEITSANFRSMPNPAT